MSDNQANQAIPASPAVPASDGRSETRLRCPICLAVFRTGFDCCPVDGAQLDWWEVGDDPLVGAEIAGRYIIEALVGEGSMGLVYRARHVRLPRTFAVKVLFGDLAADPRMRIRFAQEATLASRLGHPNVVSVVDFGRSESGLLYLVMDYVEGEALGELVAREAPLDPLRALRIARQLAQGLAHAHEHGLVHRDFKPGNVVLEQHDDGPAVPRILDFGLAISTRDQEEIAGAGGRLTELGYIVGTPIYIAPEQAMDHAVDHRADLFALGVVIYEMLAGKPPFDGRPVEIAHKNISQPVPRIAQRSPGAAVPPELERVVRRLLEKAPADRFQSAEDLCAALDAVEQAMGAEKTQGMRLVDGGAGADEIASEPNRLVVIDDEELDDLAELDRVLLWPARRRTFAATGLLLFAAGALAYGLADRAGLSLSGVDQLERPVAAEPVAAASLVSAASSGTPSLAPARATPVPERAALATTPVVSPAAAALPAPVVSPLGPEGGSGRARSRRPGPQPAPEDPVQRRAARRAAAIEIEDAATEKVARERAATDQQMVDDLVGDGAATDPPPDGEATAQPGGGAPDQAGPRAEPSTPEPGSEAAPAPAPGPAAAPAPAAPAPAASDDPESDTYQLVREYREVGQAIARLQSKQGENVTRPLRDRYFRLPYGDALRIPAVRRDTLAALAALRQEVMAAIEGDRRPARPSTGAHAPYER